MSFLAVHRPGARRMPWDVSVSSLFYLAAESVSLWADHRRWNSSPGEWGLRPWPAGGDWTGQLPTNHRCFPGALEELSQPRADRTLWLPANHTGWDQETQGKDGCALPSSGALSTFPSFFFFPPPFPFCLFVFVFVSDLDFCDFYIYLDIQQRGKKMESKPKGSFYLLFQMGI